MTNSSDVPLVPTLGVVLCAVVAFAAAVKIGYNLLFGHDLVVPAIVFVASMAVAGTIEWLTEGVDHA